MTLKRFFVLNAVNKTYTEGIVSIDATITKHKKISMYQLRKLVNDKEAMNYIFNHEYSYLVKKEIDKEVKLIEDKNLCKKIFYV